MKQIDLFVESIYEQMDGKEKEVQDMKTEMKSHLLEAVHELKLEGKSEQEAIQLAIERFGGETELRTAVREMFTIQKLFARKVLYAAVFFFVVCVMSAFTLSAEMNKAEENSLPAAGILESLGNSEIVPAQVVQDIEEIVDNDKRIIGINLYKADALLKSGVINEPIYSYREGNLFSFWNNIGFLEYNSHNYSNDIWNVQTEWKGYGSGALLILLFSIGAYWVLFAIWAIVNTYHQKRLHFGWVILFSVFNVLGYLLYVVSRRR